MDTDNKLGCGIWILRRREETETHYDPQTIRTTYVNVMSSAMFLLETGVKKPVMSQSLPVKPCKIVTWYLRVWLDQPLGNHDQQIPLRRQKHYCSGQRNEVKNQLV